MLYGRKNYLEIQSITESSRRRPVFARLRHLMAARLGHRVAGDVEQAKIELSGADQTAIELSYLQAGLLAQVNVATLAAAIADPLEALADAVEACVAAAGVTLAAVPLAVMTGGTTKMPAVHEAIRRRLPNARIESGDRFGAVGAGLARRADSVAAIDENAREVVYTVTICWEKECRRSRMETIPTT